MLRLLQESSSGVLVPSLFIDVDQIRRWLRHCDEQHAGNCHKLAAWKTISPPEKLLLIDVCWGCLVEMPGTIRYCALSYIWGELPDSLETHHENIEFLKQKGSITAKDNSSLLPETIRDAIRLVQSLGQRYLWVDRLCIIQNDDENKHLNIMRMDAIYSNSYLTIVAGDGLDANHGLPGVVDGLRPRSGTQCTVNFPRGTLVSQLICSGDRREMRLVESTSEDGRFKSCTYPDGLLCSPNNRLIGTARCQCGKKISAAFRKESNICTMNLGGYSRSYNGQICVCGLIWFEIIMKQT